LRNLPSGAVVEIDAVEVAIDATIPGAPLTVKTIPGKHVVVVKLGNDVLLADGGALEAGKQRTLFVPNPFAEDLATLAQSAWFDANLANMPHPVGEKRHNDWGIFDMYANVAEWCWNWVAPYDPDFVANPRGPNDGSARVVRGGRWRVVAADCWPAVRGGSNPSARSRRLGFRVAKYGSSR